MAGAREIDGLILVDKPEGPTSHDIVLAMRRLLGIRRVGHTGTLDPMATGLLVVLVGKATRLSEYLAGADKRYVGQVQLGSATDTGDRYGRVLEERECECDAHRLLEVEKALLGEITQVVPAYSAVKVAGRRLHELARLGLAQEKPQRTVYIRRLRLELISKGPYPVVAFDVVCSKGTYMRALAEQIGESLGCLGHLSELRRLESGKWKLDDAVKMDTLQSMGREGALERLVSMADSLSDLPRLTIEVGEEKKVENGARLQVRAGRFGGPVTPGPVRILTSQGRLAAVYRFTGECEAGEYLLEAEKVFPAA